MNNRFSYAEKKTTADMCIWFE